MKYLIASDIHGSSVYCEKLLECFLKEGSDKLILLGDILYHGPRNDLPLGYEPKKVIAMLNEIKDKIFCVRGNCDTEVDQMVLDFPLLSDYALLECMGKTVFLTHGHIYNENNLPPLSKGDIMINGHTHVPICKTYEKYVHMNPGSVSIPKENSERGYIMMEKGQFKWKTLEGKEINTYSIVNE